MPRILVPRVCHANETRTTRDRERGSISQNTTKARVPAAEAILLRPVERSHYNARVGHPRWRRYLLAASRTQLQLRAEGRDISDGHWWASEKNLDKINAHSFFVDFYTKYEYSLFTFSYSSISKYKYNLLIEDTHGIIM